eukprot:715017-Pleurochrysis_carterae.AAC.2
MFEVTAHEWTGTDAAEKESEQFSSKGRADELRLFVPMRVQKTAPLTAIVNERSSSKAPEYSK